MNQSVITKNEGLMARIGIFRTSTLWMMARSLTMIASTIALKILILSPALACDPYLYSDDFEDMLKDGESREIVLDSMKIQLNTQGIPATLSSKNMSRKKDQNFLIST